MRVPTHIESFRVSAQAIKCALAATQEVEARDGVLPRAAFNWEHEALWRTAVVDSGTSMESLRTWVDQCDDLTIVPILVLASNESWLSEELLDQYEGLGVEVLYVTPDNASFVGCEEELDPPLWHRIMLPDEAAYIPYFMLSCGHHFSAWRACGSISFWSDYGNAITRWCNVAQRWVPTLLESVFKPGKTKREPVKLTKDFLTRHDNKLVFESILGRNSQIKELHRIEIAKDLPFLRNVYFNGSATPTSIGRLPGLHVDFDFDASFFYKLKQLWDLFQMMSHIDALAAAPAKSRKAYPIEVRHDSESGISRVESGTVIGDVIFHSDGTLDVILDCLPVGVGRVEYSVYFSGLGATAGPKEVDLARGFGGVARVPKLSLARAKYVSNENMEDCIPVIVKLGGRILDCRLVL